MATALGYRGRAAQANAVHASCSSARLARFQTRTIPQASTLALSRGRRTQATRPSPHSPALGSHERSSGRPSRRRHDRAEWTRQTSPMPIKRKRRHTNEWVSKTPQHFLLLSSHTVPLCGLKRGNGCLVSWRTSSKNSESACLGLPRVMLPQMNSRGLVAGGRGLGIRPRKETFDAYGHALRHTAQCGQGASQ